jgi:RNA polymerase sigma-70 factor (ECF subfamily)
VPPRPPPDPAGAPAPGPHQFATTRWTLVAAAGKTATPEARKALGELCRLYWYPLYAFVRRRGYDADEALDLTQGFFTRLIEKNDLADASRERGRFRSWLLSSVKHFLANEWDRATAQKRGGGRAVYSIDIDPDDAERRYRHEPSHSLTPERVFDRRWALTMLEQALDALKLECDREGKAALFEALRPSLTADAQDESYQAVADRLETTQGAVKVAAHRLRRRYRDLLREQIAQTVRQPEDVDDEIRDLFAALGQPGGN